MKNTFRYFENLFVQEVPSEYMEGTFYSQIIRHCFLICTESFLSIVLFGH